MKVLTKADKDRLAEVCQKFVKDKDISCAETIYQTDRVIEGAYEFIDDVCAIVGFVEDDE